LQDGNLGSDGGDTESEACTSPKARAGSQSVRADNRQQESGPSDPTIGIPITGVPKDILVSLGYNVPPSDFENKLSKENVFPDGEDDDTGRDLDLDPSPDPSSEDLADVTKRMSIYERPLQILAFRVFHWKKVHYMTTGRPPLPERAARIRAKRDTVYVLAHFIRHWKPHAGSKDDPGKRARDVMYWSMKMVGRMEYDWTPPDNYQYNWPPNALPAEEAEADPDDAGEGSIEKNLPEESKELEDTDARCPVELQPVLREGMRLTKEARERKTRLLQDGITDIRGFASLIPPEPGDVSRSTSQKRRKKGATKIYVGKTSKAEPKGVHSPAAKRPKTGPALQFPTPESPREPKDRKCAPSQDDAASKVQDVDDWPNVPPKEPILKKTAPFKDDRSSKVLDVEEPEVAWHEGEGSKSSVSARVEKDLIGEEKEFPPGSKPKAANTEPAVSSKEDDSSKSPKAPFVGWYFAMTNNVRKFMVGEKEGRKFYRENEADIEFHMQFVRKQDYLARMKELADPNKKDPLIHTQVASQSQCASMEQNDVLSEKGASESEVEEVIAAGKTDKEVSSTSFVCRVL